jgi:hypothetical protein
LLAARVFIFPSAFSFSERIFFAISFRFFLRDGGFSFRFLRGVTNACDSVCAYSVCYVLFCRLSASVALLLFIIAQLDNLLFIFLFHISASSQRCSHIYLPPALISCFCRPRFRLFGFQEANVFQCLFIRARRFHTPQ